jgi:hypothetical protein
MIIVRLFHIQDKSFQVLAFRMIDIDRMVSRLMQLVQDADTAVCLRCRREHSGPELVLVHGL